MFYILFGAPSGYKPKMEKNVMYFIVYFSSIW